MKLDAAKVIMQEVTAWVNHHLGRGPKPEKEFNRSLAEVVMAREKILMNNILLSNSRKDHKIIGVPNEQLCAALFIASSLKGMEENTKLILSTYEGKELVLYGPSKVTLVVDPRQTSILDAIEKNDNPGMTIVN